MCVSVCVCTTYAPIPFGMVSGILVELHSQCVGLIFLDKKRCPVDMYRSDATLVFPSDPGSCNVFRPPSAAAYLQTEKCPSAYSQRSGGRKTKKKKNPQIKRWGSYRQSSPTQIPETGCVGRCLQTVFCVRQMLQHLHAPKPR